MESDVKIYMKKPQGKTMFTRDRKGQDKNTSDCYTILEHDRDGWGFRGCERC
jgi:hypothetical protein